MREGSENPKSIKAPQNNDLPKSVLRDINMDMKAAKTRKLEKKKKIFHEWRDKITLLQDREAKAQEDFERRVSGDSYLNDAEAPIRQMEWTLRIEQMTDLGNEINEELGVVSGEISKVLSIRIEGDEIVMSFVDPEEQFGGREKIIDVRIQPDGNYEAKEKE